MEVAAVGEVSIVIAILVVVLSNNGSKDLVCSSMVKVMLLQLTFCGDSEQSVMLCGEAMVCFLCEQLDDELLLWQTCIMIGILRKQLCRLSSGTMFSSRARWSVS